MLRHTLQLQLKLSQITFITSTTVKTLTSNLENNGAPNNTLVQQRNKLI